MVLYWLIIGMVSAYIAILCDKHNFISQWFKNHFGDGNLIDTHEDVLFTVLLGFVSVVVIVGNLVMFGVENYKQHS